MLIKIYLIPNIFQYKDQANLNLINFNLSILNYKILIIIKLNNNLKVI